MIFIGKPRFSVNEVFTACISTVQNQQEKNQLKDCIDMLDEAESIFDKKFQDFTLYEIAQEAIVLGNVGKEEMKSVYNYRMVNKDMPANAYYNKLKLSAPAGKCPLCAARQVDTIDHYLPKSKYPIYSVTPLNLIPACIKCNTGKHVEFPKSSEDQTFHPYYDNIQNENWLDAKVLQTSPASFQFYVNPPLDWPPLLKTRIMNHFKSFELNELYSSHASEELQGFRKRFINLYNKHPDELKAHLLDSYYSTLVFGKNYWKSVMYRILSNDAWFTSEGVLA